MMESTKLIVHAAKNRNSWGRLNALAFIKNRGIDYRLYRLACQLEAMQKAGE